MIARMDADDVCLPGRLSAQLQYMARHPECRAVGGGALVFRHEQEGGQGWQGRVARVSMQPCQPRLLSWSLLFSCTVTHPSVLLRRSAIGTLDDGDGHQPALVYDPHAFPAE